MDHFIEQIVIDNFKSIRHLQLDGLKRINLFIGRPNVGKSNILEALALLSTSWKKLTDIVRVENLREVFYDGNLNGSVNVCVKSRSGRSIQEKGHFRFFKSSTGASLDFTREDSGLINKDYTVHLSVSNEDFHARRSVSYDGFYDNDIKKYTFKHDVKFQEVQLSHLSSPFGENILYILELYPDLRKLYAQWFRQYGLRLVLDTASQSLKVQKEKGEDEVFQLPYSSVADTLQRIIFYKTAVASNENSILLFEEPEAHAFPPYIVEFTQEVIKSLTNQFFIVTHSPLIVEEFLTNAIDELGISNVDFKDGQTVVRPLTTEEIYDVRKYGVDLFFNNEAYLA
ncbi:AAA family ATPase [uncultured Spirosoma sp.]|uniref:AAA family ATPase n=1 Tax=uncultured Spirosoma sp. TaxID=278208 RepID=UPI0025908288|nr:AAA family ATPase [uncultured Spirosoma sp.]